MSTYQGQTGEWEVVVGLEVHAQIVSKAKLFSGASTAFGAEPNSQVSFVDAAFPGMLPVINAYCVEQAVRTGLGLKAKINPVSRFDRKNYYYPDLPAGYQISQYDQPIVGPGEVLLDMPDGKTRTVGITRLHMEQDAGKSLHDQDPERTFVDLNRAGTGLMEIVSEPDIRSAEEAGMFLEKLRSILRYLGTCDGNMQEGSMRADVNVSVRPVGEEGYRTRCEIKNINSVRFVKQAIDVEAARQIALYEDGEAPVQETRLFDPERGETRPMRTKEEAHDYRYFPDPDLLPLVLDEQWIADIEASLPELPDAKKERFVRDFGLGAYVAGVLVGEKADAEFYESVLAELARMTKLPQERYAVEAANLVANDVFGRLNEAALGALSSPVSPVQIAELIGFKLDGTLSGRMVKDVFAEMFETGRNAGEIVAEKGLEQISDTGELEGIVDRLIADNAEQAKQVQENPKVMGWFVGQVMKATQGKANPQAVNEILRRKLGL